MKSKRALAVLVALALIASPIALSANECRDGFEMVTFIVGATGKVIERCLPVQAVEAGAGGYVGDPNACPVDIEIWANKALDCAEPTPIEPECYAQDEILFDEVVMRGGMAGIGLYMVTVYHTWPETQGSETILAYKLINIGTECDYDNESVVLSSTEEARACAAILYAFMANNTTAYCGDFPDFEP